MVGDYPGWTAELASSPALTSPWVAATDGIFAGTCLALSAVTLRLAVRRTPGGGRIGLALLAAFLLVCAISHGLKAISAWAPIPSILIYGELSAAASAIVLTSLILWRATPRRGHSGARDSNPAQSSEDHNQRHRLETLGHLVSGVAHDFNNSTAAAIAGMRLFNKRFGHLLGQNAEAQTLLRSVCESMERGAGTARQLLTVTRREHFSAEPTDLGSVLANLAGGALQSTMGRASVRIEVQPIAASVPSVTTDQNHLTNAIINLAINARDAMPEGGTIRISATPFCAQKDGMPNLAEGEYVRVDVADTGMGMDEVTLRRACEPFFTTKPIGSGTGLGLAMVQQFVFASGGTMQITSIPGRGTTVSIWLPAAHEPQAPLRPNRGEEDKALKGSSRIPA